MIADVNNASAYFNKDWERYQNTIKNNTLYHHEMLSALQQFLSANIGSRPFSFVDVGCGDSATVAPILSHTAIKKYIGIDAAEDVLKMASNTLAPLDCEKKFIAEDMLTAIPRLSESVDIIFTSYAVHHLSNIEKENFIAHCKQKLNPNGFFLMVDGVLKPNQTRDEWLDALENRIAESYPDITSDELAKRMQHPRSDDFPDAIKTFSQIAQKQSWKDFEVLVEKGIFAFMVFAK